MDKKPSLFIFLPEDKNDGRSCSMNMIRLVVAPPLPIMNPTIMMQNAMMINTIVIKTSTRIISFKKLS